MKEGKGTVLVTGGAGYIGSHTALALIEAGNSVIVLDNLSTGDRDNVPAEATFVQGDVGNVDLVSSVLTTHDIDTVMHFAGLIKVEESVREPERYMHANVDDTRALAHHAVQKGVKHFIFSSSAAVYGNAELNPIPENAPLHPMSPYADSKKRAEEAIAEVLRGSSTRATILRYFNVAGCDPSGRAGYSTKDQPSSLIRTAVRALLQGAPFTIFGDKFPTPDGTCIRDFMHVSDLADAHVAALSALEAGSLGNIYNCGSGHGYSNREVVRTVERLGQRHMDVRIGAERPGDLITAVADTTRIRAELGWKTKRSLEDMIRDELAWTRMKL